MIRRQRQSRIARLVAKSHYDRECDFWNRLEAAVSARAYADASDALHFLITEIRLACIDNSLATCGNLEFAKDVGNLVSDSFGTRNKILSDCRVS